MVYNMSNVQFTPPFQTECHFCSVGLGFGWGVLSGLVFLLLLVWVFFSVEVICSKLSFSKISLRSLKTETGTLHATEGSKDVRSMSRETLEKQLSHSTPKAPCHFLLTLLIRTKQFRCKSSFIMSSFRSVSDKQCKAKALWCSMNHVVGFEYGMWMSLLPRESNGQEPKVSTNGEVGVKNEVVCEPGEWRMNGQKDEDEQKWEITWLKSGSVFYKVPRWVSEEQSTVSSPQQSQTRWALNHKVAENCIESRYC